ncbi:MAG: tetratricopeptide repeat protein, partial [Armatimonadota bacterium]
MELYSKISLSYRKGLEFYDQGLYVDALEAFEDAFEQAGPDTPEGKLAAFHIGETHARLAEECVRKGLRDRAELHLREAITKNPKYPDLRYQLAEILFEKGESGRALSELAEAININSQYARAWLLRGIITYSLGEYEEGLGYITRATELEPGYK